MLPKHTLIQLERFNREHRRSIASVPTLTDIQHLAGSYMGSAEPNSGTHMCVANTLLTKPYPQPLWRDLE